jgi:hypothetical protein
MLTIAKIAKIATIAKIEITLPRLQHRVVDPARASSILAILAMR